MINFRQYEIEQTHWQNLIAHKESSANPTRRRSLIMGVDPVTNGTVSVPGTVLDGGHLITFGRTEAGKTSCTLLSLIFQLIRGYRDALGHWSEKSPVIVFDLKGDSSLFHATKDAAEADCRSFRHLSSVIGSGYYYLDPFEFIAPDARWALKLASDWVRSLGLDNGIVYGGKYFTDQNIVLLIRAFVDMLRMGGQPSIGALAFHLKRCVAKTENRDAKHIELCLSMLAQYPQINLGAHRTPPTDRIDFAAAIEKGDVLYFHLELNKSGSPLRQVAAIALTTLIQAAKRRRLDGFPKKRIFVVVDEFFHIAGKAFGDLLATCRDWGIHFILACQTMSQLKSHDPDLPAGVMTNTTVKQFYSGVDREEIEFLRDASGQTTRFSFGTNSGPTGNSYSVSEKDGWYLDSDAIRRMSDQRLLTAILVDDGLPWENGKRVRLCRALHPIPRAHHLYYDHKPLPSTPNAHVPVHVESAAVKKPVRSATRRYASGMESSEEDSLAAGLNERMAKMFTELLALEESQPA